MGYGKQRRLTGEITSFGVDPYPANRPGWKECYGNRHVSCACIGIKLENGAAVCAVNGGAN